MQFTILPLASDSEQYPKLPDYGLSFSAIIDSRTFSKQGLSNVDYIQLYVKHPLIFIEILMK